MRFGRYPAGVIVFGRPALSRLALRVLEWLVAAALAVEAAGLLLVGLFYVWWWTEGYPVLRINIDEPPTDETVPVALHTDIGLVVLASVGTVGLFFGAIGVIDRGQTLRAVRICLSFGLTVSILLHAFAWGCGPRTMFPMRSSTASSSAR